MFDFRQATRKREFSDEVNNVLLHSWRPQTIKQYDVYLKKWFTFTNQRSVNSFSPSVGNVLEFLYQLFDSGYSYSALNSARSTLSSFITFDNQPLGCNPCIVRFLRGCFNLRPSLPRTNVTWDVDRVLSYLKNLYPLCDLTLKDLTLKCVSLLAIVSGQRMQSLFYIDVRNIEILFDRLKIRFGDLLKTSRPNFHQKELCFESYTDKRLCIVTTFQEYIKRTETLRSSGTQLFISYTKPYSSVTRSTIARWVKVVLFNSGIDMCLFTPHSVRGASTSAAHRKRVPLATILETAGWSNSKTFARFYNKPIH
ncbi:uncharacterized protein LOC130013683 [Patella vulgata]|uniref:uncharacterized protein LOC130013683 n=1 Tax=Patella vulgata TaxID=6465 RepID=UPI0024A825C3|nr:uncharacterized protein LOC130013683 [Patella vulgata]